MELIPFPFFNLIFEIIARLFVFLYFKIRIRDVIIAIFKFWSFIGSWPTQKLFVTQKRIFEIIQYIFGFALPESGACSERSLFLFVHRFQKHNQCFFVFSVGVQF